MSDEGNIPTLTDLIESGDRIDIADLGLDEELGVNDNPQIDDTVIDITGPELDGADALTGNLALEQAIRRILDEHMELALQEIKLLLRQESNK